MPDWLSEEFVRRHGIPVACSFATILLLGLLAEVLLLDNTRTGFWVAIGCGGIPIGWLTPKEAIDHRGTNGSVVLVTCWMTAMLMSRHILGPYIFVSDWVFPMLTFNIISGFSLVGGILLGTLLRMRAVQPRSVAGKSRKPTQKVLPTTARTGRTSAWAETNRPTGGESARNFNQTKDSSGPEN